jgi:hypothetical protein
LPEPAPALTPKQLRQYAIKQVQGNLESMLVDPAVFLQTVRPECKYFLAGAVYPYVIPAFEYVKLDLAG